MRLGRLSKQAQWKKGAKSKGRIELKTTDKDAQRKEEIRKKRLEQIRKMKEKK